MGLFQNGRIYLNPIIVKRSFEKLIQFKIIDPYVGITQRFNLVIVFLSEQNFLISHLNYSKWIWITENYRFLYYYHLHVIRLKHKIKQLFLVRKNYLRDRNKSIKQVVFKSEIGICFNVA